MPRPRNFCATRLRLDPEPSRRSCVPCRWCHPNPLHPWRISARQTRSPELEHAQRCSREPGMDDADSARDRGDGDRAPRQESQTQRLTPSSARLSFNPSSAAALYFGAQLYAWSGDSRPTERSTLAAHCG